MARRQLQGEAKERRNTKEKLIQELKAEDLPPQVDTNDIEAEEASECNGWPRRARRLPRRFDDSKIFIDWCSRYR
jgi:hypothetical protein